MSGSAYTGDELTDILADTARVLSPLFATCVRTHNHRETCQSPNSGTSHGHHENYKIGSMRL